MPMLKRPGGAGPPTPLDDDQIYFMRREIANASFALFGLVLALLVLARIRGWACLARYHHQPRKGTLASLLNAMIQALFVLNAVYAFAFLVVAVVEVGYLSSKGKAKLYGEEGTWSDEATLQSWGKAYSHMTHVLQQLSLLPQFWHCALAWLFYAYIVQGRTAAALERIVRERIVWYWLAAVVVAAGVSAMCFYAPAGSKLHQAEVLWTATTTSVSLLVVLSLYIQTLYHWRRGSSHGGSYGGASTKGTAAAGSALGRGRASGDGNGSTQDLAEAEAGGAGGSFRLPRSDSPTQAQAVQAQAQQLRRPLWRLVTLLAFFLAIGTWALVNECRAAAAALGGYSGRRGTGDMPIVILTVVDALVLGNVLFCLYPSCLHPGRRRQRKQQRALSQRRQQLLLDQQRRRGAMAERKGNHGSAGVGGSGGQLVGSGVHSATALQKRSQGSDSLNSGVVLRPQSRQDRQLRIFASTFNAGSTKSCAALGPVDAWVPPGFDLYIIGIQECMVVDELGAVIHKHLGGPSQYVAHADGVWSTNGEIALLLFARAEDAASGAFELLGGLTTKVNLGASVGVGKLPNKAAVGLACRLNDRTLAAVTAHFAADKHGKERPEARVRDAVRSLKGLSLGGECEEVDLQHAFHHVVVLGDLNFRVRLPPECVVQRLAASVGEEKKALARLLLSGGGQDRQPATGAPFAPPLAASASALSIASTNSSLGSTSNGAAAPASTTDAPVSALARPMRLARYQSAVQGLPQPPPFGSQVSLARTNSREGAEGGDGAPCPSTASSDETTTVEERQSDVVVEMRGEEEDDVVVVVVAQEQQAAGATAPSNATAAVIDAPGYYHQLCPPESPVEEAEEGDEAEARRLREWWRWVQEHDELGRVMRAGACFHGFVEGPLCFPPSFRWVRGARANYSLEGAAAFDGCYTLVKASEGAKGLRPPSFTDRVLVHSLPDLAGDMAIEEYDMCEAMTGSDHRPVAAALRLTVDASPAAAQGRRADKEQTTTTTTRTRKLVVALSDVYFVSLAGGAAASPAGARPSLSPVSSSSSTVPLEHAEGGEGKAEEAEPAPRPAEGERWLPRLMGAMGYQGGITAAQGPVPVPAAEALSALIVHYPLLMEDSVSLAEQRKAAEMKEGLEQGFALGRRERKREREAREAAAVAAILDSDDSAGAIADTEPGFGQAQGVGAGGQGTALHHLDSVHTLSLKRHARSGDGGGDGSAGHPLSFRVAVHERVPRGGEDEGNVLPGLPQYAVVRVRDRRKGEIGQAVLCLREALPRTRRRRTGKGDGGGEEEEEDERERGAFLEASVCDGGRLVGQLLLRAEVLTEEEERRRRKRELQERVGFLASANATIRGLATKGAGSHAGSLS